MTLTKEQIKQIKDFDFRYAEKIIGSVYEVQQVKKFFPNPTGARILDQERICFWHDDCVDHACCIKIKDILFN